MKKHFRRIPLWVRIYLMVYILSAVVIMFFFYRIITMSNNHNLNKELSASLDKHLMLTNAMKMSSHSITDELNNSPELQYKLLSIFLENYGEYYLDSSSFVKISNSDGRTLFSSMTDDMVKAMKLDPPEDGRRSYVIHKFQDNTFVFVSGYIEIGHHMFRLDYASNISDLIYSQKRLSTQISLMLAVGMLFLAVGLLFMIRGALNPLAELSLQAKTVAEGNYQHQIEVRGSDEIGQLAVEFNQMTESIRRHTQMLQEEIKERERFMASMAHELKTPITSIMGYVSLLKNYNLDREETEKALNFIDKESKRLDEISKKLLSLFRISGGQGVTKKKISVTSMFKQLESISGMFLAEREQSLKLEAFIEYIDGDEELLMLLLNNLVENASKFSARGSHILVNAYGEGSSAIFSVRDYGCGISQEHIDRVFQPFFMSDASRSKKENSYGLGLSLCKAIAEAHGGRIYIDSQLGKGTCVFVSIPQ